MSWVAKGHFRRKREAPLILRGSTSQFRGHPRTSATSPGVRWRRHGRGGRARSGPQIPGHVPGSGWSILGEPPGGTRGKVT